ncbi:arginine--tRNA ligase [Candidatus Nomurabacteria bacterium]|nr:arginine--tRNA ligase [Candidatus Nomurabacteria bacterium]
MQDVLREAINEALTELGLPEIDFTIEHPSDLTHGDYASNVAMVVAKEAGKAPREIAEQVRAALVDQIEYIEKIEVAGPGFLNFYLARDFFVKETVRALQEQDKWGRHDTWKGEKVVVEYTDPNPFKEFHIGHVFTNTVGESIARLFMMAGAEVKRVNYQGDVGLHVACALYGLQQMGITADAELDAKLLGMAYARGATANKEDETAQQRIREINKAVYERSDTDINALYDRGRAVSLEYFEDIYKLLGTQFDDYFFESEAGPRGKEIVLSHPNIFPESEGAHVFKGEEYGLHTRVFLNKEGLPTYEAKELALAKLKEERLGEYDHSVVSTSNEITEYFKVLLRAISLVYPELAAKTEHIGHGTVRLSTGKMSSRTGQVIVGLDFISEIADAAMQKMQASQPDFQPDSILAQKIAIAAIKYATLKGNILQDAVFDKEQALSFEGNSGPYLQYTYARIQSVKEKAAKEGVSPQFAQVPTAPYEIERIIYRFTSVVASALADREPHQLVTYLTTLASGFNTFYANEKIADAGDEYAPYKLALAEAVAQTLKNGMWALGIEAPERM